MKISVSIKFIVANGCKSEYIIKATIPGLCISWLGGEDRVVGRFTTDRIMITLGIFMFF